MKKIISILGISLLLTINAYATRIEDQQSIVGTGSNLFLKLDQTTPQTVANGLPYFSQLISGSVLFAGVSGQLAQDNSSFYYDAANYVLNLTGLYVGNSFPGTAISGIKTTLVDSPAYNTGNLSDGIFRGKDFGITSGMYGESDVTIYSPNPFMGSARKDIILDSAKDIKIPLYDAAGAAKLYIQDSGTATIFSVDSDGNGIFAGTLGAGAITGTSLSTGSGTIGTTGNITAGTFYVTGNSYGLTKGVNAYDWTMGAGELTAYAFHGTVYVDTRDLRIIEPTSTDYVSFKSPALAASTVYTLPNAFPVTNPGLLKSTTAGAMTWDTSAYLTADPYWTRSSTTLTTLTANDALQVNGGFLSTGTTLGYTIPSGAGTRFMWIPSLAAFRAGLVANTEWDTASIGVGSAAFGDTTMATGAASLAVGKVNPEFATATIEARGIGSFAGGYAYGGKDGEGEPSPGSILAEGNGSFACGAAVGGNTGASAILASGQGSVAVGQGTTASGTASFAAGLNNTASGVGSFAAGYYNNIASGDGSVAIGTGTTASGVGSFAGGSSSVASTFYATAMGYSAKASGTSSVAIGEVPRSRGNASVSIGFYPVASNQYSVAIGHSPISSVIGVLALGKNVYVMDTTSVDTEKITNGTFATGTTSWTLGAAWQWVDATDNVQKFQAGTNTLSQTSAAMVSPLVVGEMYLLTYTISGWTVGTVTPSCGGVTLPAFGANDTYKEVFIASSTADLVFTPTNTAAFYIDTISLKKITGGDLIVAGRTGYPIQAKTLAAAATTLAITSNVVKLTGDAGGNTLATITGGLTGQTLTIIFVDALVTITDTDAATANTVNLSAAFTSTANDTLTLIMNGTSWRETARSVN